MGDFIHGPELGTISLSLGVKDDAGTANCVINPVKFQPLVIHKKLLHPHFVSL